MNDIHSFLQEKSKTKINIQKLHDLKITRGRHLLALDEEKLAVIIEKGNKYCIAITYTLLLLVLGGIFDSKEKRVKRAFLAIQSLIDQVPVDFYEWREKNKVKALLYRIL